MLNKNVETFIGCDAEYRDADVVLFGAPFDSTTSFRPGARFGCKAVRAESFGLETYSPYLDKDLTELSVFDSGDLELCFGDTRMALDQIGERTETILSDGKIPFMIGGEHLVTLGAVEKVCARYPDLHLIHFDAHTDLREEYLGTPLSHAAVIRRCHDLLGDGRIYQFGIRSGEKAEFEFGRRHTGLTKFNLNGLAETAAALQDKPVYFTLDLDILDPSIFSGTGTPEAGGISFMELLTGIYTLRNLNIVGCDVCELAPSYDPSGVSTAVTGKIIREMLLTFHWKQNGGR